MDSHNAALDDGDVGPSDAGDSARSALGLQRPRMGWVLGLGPGRKCIADAVANGHCVSAFGDDAGKARHAEDLEHVADFHHVHVVYLWYLSDAQRRGEFGARVCAVLDRDLVRGFSRCNLPCLRPTLLEESRAFEERTPARIHE